MLISELYTKKGDVSYFSNHESLYHLTDYHGLIDMIFNDRLASKSQDYISTTYNKDMNYVEGRWHYHFKFELDANKCAKDFGIFPVEDFIYVGNDLTKMEEDEIGINTREIKPLQNYLKSLIILIPINSRSFVQWLFYKEQNGTGVEALKRLSDEKIKIKKNNRNLNSEERKIINYCFQIRNKVSDFYEAYSMLAKKFKFVDHFNNRVDELEPERESKRDWAIEILNHTLTSKPINKITPEEIRTMIISIMEIFNYGDNYISNLISIIEEMELLNSYIEPVHWSSLVRDLIKNEPIDEIIQGLQFTKDRLQEVIYMNNRIRTEHRSEYHTKTG